MLDVIESNLKQERTQIYGVDLKGYFDSIPHDKLMEAVGFWIVQTCVASHQAVAHDSGDRKKRTLKEKQLERHRNKKRHGEGISFRFWPTFFYTVFFRTTIDMGIYLHSQCVNSQYICPSVVISRKRRRLRGG